MNTLKKISYGILSVSSCFLGFQFAEKRQVKCALHNFCHNTPGIRFDLKHLLGGFRPVYSRDEMITWCMQRWNQELATFFAARGLVADRGSVADGMNMYDAPRVTFITETLDQFYPKVTNLPQNLLDQLFIGYNYRFQSRLYWHPTPVELIYFARHRQGGDKYLGYVCRNRFVKHSLEGVAPYMYPYHYEGDVFLPVTEDYQNIYEYKAAYTPEQRDVLETYGCAINELLLQESICIASAP